MRLWSAVLPDVFGKVERRRGGITSHKPTSKGERENGEDMILRMRNHFDAARFVAAFVIALASTQGFAQMATSGDATDRINKILKAEEAKGSLSGVVVIDKGNSEVFAKAYGFADRAHHIPNTLKTPFRIMSLSKQFTAAAILVLQEQRKLSTDEPVGAYLPGLPSFWQKVTLKQLMSHTSGIPSYTDESDLMTWGAQDHTPKELIDKVRNVPMVFPTGTKWRYSNTNYVLLGLIVERVSGQSLDHFLDTTFFQPLQMTHTTAYKPSMRHLPKAYVQTQRGIQPASEMSMTITFAAGQLVSTASDLLKWERALYSGHVLSQESLQEMLTPTQVSGADRYAEGLTLADSQPGSRVESHIGLWPGLGSYMAHVDQGDVVVVLLENVENSRDEQPNVLGRALVEAAVGGHAGSPAAR